MVPEKSFPQFRPNIALKLAAVVNLTTDSFSDGGKFFDENFQPEKVISYAKTLIEHGADILDIGADSTRPGSKCVGITEEWNRLQPIIENLAGEIPLSIDTHHPEVAKLAIEHGANIINDISGASEKMMRVCANANTRLICMYSKNIGKPHDFTDGKNLSSQDLIDDIKKFFDRQIALSQQIGLRRDQLILDPGMGAFLSSNHKDSFWLLKNLSQLKSYAPLMIGVSRKGFLKEWGANSNQQKDIASTFIAKFLHHNLDFAENIIWRVHNVQIHRLFSMG